jgi:hypothetical protein
MDEFVLPPTTNNERQEVLVQENFNVENQEVEKEEQKSLQRGQRGEE